MGVSLLLLLELKEGRIFKDCGIECLRFFPHLYFPFPSYASSSRTQAPHGLEVDAEKKRKGKPLKKIQPTLLLILFYLVRVRQVTHRYTAEVFSFCAVPLPGSLRLNSQNHSSLLLPRYVSAVPLLWPATTGNLSRRKRVLCLWGRISQLQHWSQIILCWGWVAFLCSVCCF